MKWIVVSLAKVLISSKHLQLSMPGWTATYSLTAIS